MTRYVAMENGDMVECEQGAWVKYSDVFHYQELEKELQDLYERYEELKKRTHDTEVKIRRFAKDVRISIKDIDKAFELYGIRDI